ncbi:uncharacterized protein BDZ99DRAFT_387406 [Mytilinidion resinicola]|uniref:INSIG domain-containing protein n=1 Tax=Mytilinidion resinicola TaxID=574789 RepID=A0A6A6YMW3_9PEZI|nr:uncharacterized protein BDZ99DRAFT_387406 [Mytilinidion resinicola]KAF2810081.1 hypothetical protein BDZ99DRAFT_387406 [Mytilinidion resinicola]
MSQEPSPLPGDIPTSNPSHIHRPVPRRHFEMSTPASEGSHSPTRGASSDFVAQLDAKLRRSRTGSGNGGDLDATSRTKSFLNMTSSTLFGIYSDAGTGDRTEPQTPWGTGAETPARYGGDPWDNNPLDQAALDKKGGELWERPQQKQVQGVWGYLLLIGRILALFAFGVVYGIIVSHLHDTRNLAPVRMQGVDRTQWQYYTVWGTAGIVLGSLLPYVDLLWARSHVPEQVRRKRAPSRSSPLGEQWNPVVRSIGAFVGIAFAIRKLPWTSTLQVSVTLALVNPALWYILDRSKPGLTLSTLVSVILTSVLLLAKPDVVPPPAVFASNATRLPPSSAAVFTGKPSAEAPPAALFAGVVSYESLGVATWIASVLFCSCICFGNIGRRLAVLDNTRWSR